MIALILSNIGVFDVKVVAYVIVGLEVFLVLLKIVKVFVKRDSAVGKILDKLIPALYDAVDELGGKENVTKQISDGKPELTERSSDENSERE